MRLLSCWLVLVLASMAWAADDTGKTGYVFCSSADHRGPRGEPLFPGFCAGRMNPGVSCGEKVTVVGRVGQWLQVVTARGVPRTIPATAISQEKENFVAFDSSAVPEASAPDCSVSQRPNFQRPPRALFQPGPEYSEEARKKQIEGVVQLSIVIGTDGIPHDVKVEKGLGYGLDEKAVQAVEKWRFEPPERDGQPTEQKVAVEVSFHLYGPKH